MDKTLKEIAEQAKPGWKVVDKPQVDALPAVEADAVGLDIEALKRKYISGYADHARDSAGAAKAPPDTSEHTHFVPMKPEENNLDSTHAADEKYVLIRDKRIIGYQG